MTNSGSDNDRAAQINPIVKALQGASQRTARGGLPNCTVLTGFLGEGGEGSMRLYSTLEMNTWIEFDGADLLHSTTVDKSGVPVSVVWVRKDAPVRQVSSTDAQSAFVQGSIVDSMLAGSVGESNEQGIIRTITRVSRRICPSWRWCPDTGYTFCAPGSCLVCARV